MGITSVEDVEIKCHNFGESRDDRMYRKLRGRKKMGFKGRSMVVLG